MSQVEIETPHGLARAHLHPVDKPKAAMAMCHGAGVGVDSPDLVVATEVANAADISVALIEMPYLVAGRKSPQPAKQLDVCFTTVIGELQGDQLKDLPLMVGGRSMGARVACRTAGELDAIAVLCLAFPVRPPTRQGKPPKPDRHGRARRREGADPRRPGREGSVRPADRGAEPDDRERRRATTA